MLVDPHKSLMVLLCACPGTVKEGCGVGGHQIDNVDTKIRRIKDPMCSVLAGQPYKLPRACMKDLANYVMNRIYNQSMTALSECMSLRVSFKGVKTEFCKEYGLAFRYYAETYNP